MFPTFRGIPPSNQIASPALAQQDIALKDYVRLAHHSLYSNGTSFSLPGSGLTNE